MKRVFTFILTVVILSITIVGCSKKNPEPKLTEEEQAELDKKKDEEVKAALVGKWERIGFEANAYKGGKLAVKITDDEMLAELQREMPSFFEITKTEFIMVDLVKDEHNSQSYTLDSKTNTIIITDDLREDGVEVMEATAKYDLAKDNNGLTIILQVDGIDSSDLYDAVHVTVKLKRIAAWPTPS